MKNLKKLISVIIAVIMIVGSFATVSAADYKDVDSTNSFYKAINVLSGLGIVTGDDEGNFNPKSDIKRSEMLALVCRAMGEEDIATNSASNAFTDVAANHWAAGYIAWGVNRSIVNGMGDGTFAPDASVSYQDAVVMIMRALGYERIAQRSQNGGYPAGYLKLASQRGILKDAGYDNQAAAPREVVAQLIYNSLTAPLVDVKQYGMNYEDDIYVIHDGSDTSAPLRTLLTYTNDIYKVKADVVDTAKTNSALIDKDGSYKVTLEVSNTFGYDEEDVYEEIGIGSDDKVTVYVGETDAADLLGATVEAYLAEDEDLNAWKLLAVVADAKSVKTETITAAEVDFIGYEAEVFTYEDADGQEEEIELAAETGLTIYYNGKKVGLASAFETNALDTLLMAAEEITFSGSRTSAYDKIFITDYVYDKVKKVYAEDLYISADGLDLELDAEARNNKKFTYGLYDGNGKAISIEDIAEDDILNIVAPLTVDKTTGTVNPDELATISYMDVYVTSNTITGAVTEDYLDGRYSIDGSVYKMVSGSLPTAAEGEFYVTIDGRIYAYDASSTISKDFGFIVRAYSEGKYDNTVYENTIRMYTADGKLVNFLVADRLKITGTVVTAGTYTDSALNTMVGTTIKALCADSADEATAETSLVKRFVTYKLNSDGEIRELSFNGTADVTMSTGTATYRSDLNTFAGKKIEDATKLFIAPVSEVDTDKWNVDEDDIKLGSFSSMKHETSSANAVTVTFSSSARTLAAALLSNKVDAEFDGSHFAVVTARGSVYDAEYDSLIKYTFIQSGETVQVTLSPDAEDYDSIDALSYGDVVFYAVDAEGMIEKMLVIYDASEDTFNAGDYTVGNIDTNEFAIVKGEITDLEDGVMTVYGVGDYLVGDADGNTYVSIDATGSSINAKDVTMLRSAASLRASTPSKTYTVITIFTEDDTFEDCVMILTNPAA